MGERTGVDGLGLARTSRLVAKVDSAAVQDGFDIYLHAFIVSRDGNWAVVQQGMRPERKRARRYHWLSERLRSFVDDPHAAIDGESEGSIVNLADHRAERSRKTQVGLVQQGPDRVLRALAVEVLPRLSLPAHHALSSDDVGYIGEVLSEVLHEL